MELEGIAPDSSGRMLRDALVSAKSISQNNFPGFLRSMPGEQASIDLSKVANPANRLKTNLEKEVALLQVTEAAFVTSALREPLRGGWSREERRLSMDHRPHRLTSARSRMLVLDLDSSLDLPAVGPLNDLRERLHEDAFAQSSGLVILSGRSLTLA